MTIKIKAFTRSEIRLHDYYYCEQKERYKLLF